MDEKVMGFWVKIRNDATLAGGTQERSRHIGNFSGKILATLESKGSKMKTRKCRTYRTRVTQSNVLRNIVHETVGNGNQTARGVPAMVQSKP
jgi:hypothetical protein